ncbi:diguanylate cyclase (GGDEF)-like protein [Paenarthrobacter nicotinovorans]|uniref:putative bifunctional diguanylate cyclase/phosphodiesterase n=1 Tax=Paenarthrobacter nicotinovorans TaxID=29320 RepID=UPI00277DDA1A|nr:bifunctional diguanylate cyclase/phosphodiesterase [Paenarthrobacter nicotinovorans]MDP9935962.1 diguanylate cyclase (GGDEF)-like protein [Paenarthrobacter nicotinovorans]
MTSTVPPGLVSTDDDPRIRRLERQVRALMEELHHVRKEQRHDALTDSLTGVGNRLALARAFREATEAAAKGGAPPALILLNLYGFTSLKNSAGHAAADQVLVTVAMRIRSAVRENDVVTRLGGDDFAVLMPATPQARATAVGNRIMAALEPNIDLGNNSVQCAASMGLRVAEPHHTLEDLLQEAGFALEESKAEGRNKLKLFDPVTLHFRQLQRQIVGDLREGIRSDQLVLYYQPVVDLGTGKLEGCEALVRWNHPIHGLIMPDQFIPVAEATGLIAELGRWVLRTAMRQLRQWRNNPATLQPAFSMRINVSAADLQSLEFVDDVRDVLMEEGLSPDSLVLELTESAIIRNNELDRYTLMSLHRLGVGLEIDDFGAGYSSMGYLRKLPVDRVKVDRQFVKDLANDPSQLEFVAAIQQVIRSCGLEGVWEGIETAQEAELLRSIGCTSGQGYYFGKPVPGPEFTGLLETNRSWPA